MFMKYIPFISTEYRLLSLAIAFDVNSNRAKKVDQICFNPDFTSTLFTRNMIAGFD